MKSKINFLAAFFILINIYSCGDELDDLLEIDVDTVLIENFNVQIEAGQNNTFNKSEVFNISNKDTEKYLNSVKNLAIKKLTFKFENFTGDPAGILKGEFYADDILLLKEDILVKTASDQSTIFEVTNTELINQIATKLKAGNNVALGIKGTSSSSTAMNFDVEATISVVLTANLVN
ncbi:MAG: hypothetical protein KBE41_04790 [Lutibacter sp.]|nr:hypothetical protein [Lutibacter sp.]MBP9600801.1 hypothetical protein [Lutibacter sp.]